MRTSLAAQFQPQLAAVRTSLKGTRGKLIWAGGSCALLIGILVTSDTFSSTNASSPSKAASVPDGKQVVATAAETNPVPVPNGVYGAAVWIPVYPGSTPAITSSAQTPESDQNVSTFKTGDAPPKVIAYFQNQLKSSGFNIKAASSGEENGSLQAEDGLKKRSLVLNVNASSDGPGADARLVTSEKK